MRQDVGDHLVGIEPVRCPGGADVERDPPKSARARQPGGGLTCAALERILMRRTGELAFTREAFVDSAGLVPGGRQRLLDKRVKACVGNGIAD